MGCRSKWNRRITVSSRQNFPARVGKTDGHETASTGPLALALPKNSISPESACACWQKRPQLSRPVARTANIVFDKFLI